MLKYMTTWKNSCGYTSIFCNCSFVIIILVHTTIKNDTLYTVHIMYVQVYTIYKFVHEETRCDEPHNKNFNLYRHSSKSSTIYSWADTIICNNRNYHFSMILHVTVVHATVVHAIVVHVTDVHATVVHATVVHATVVHVTVVHATVVHVTVVHVTVVHVTVVHVTVVHVTVVHATVVHATVVHATVVLVSACDRESNI